MDPEVISYPCRCFEDMEYQISYVFVKVLGCLGSAQTPHIHFKVNENSFNEQMMTLLRLVRLHF